MKQTAALFKRRLRVQLVSCYSAARLSTKPQIERWLQGRPLSTGGSRIKALDVKPRLDYKQLVQNVDQAVDNARNRKVTNADPNKVVELYGAYKEALTDVEKLNSERKSLAKQAQKKIEEGKMVKEALHLAEHKLSSSKEDLDAEAMKLPNETHPDVPIGDETKNQVIRQSSRKQDSSVCASGALNHIEIGERLDLFDFGAASMVVAPKFVTLKNEAALMELGLITYAMTELKNKGFKSMILPDIAHTEAVAGSGFNPRSDSSQLYFVTTHSHLDHKVEKQEKEWCLVGTSEVPIAASFANRVFKEEELPLRIAGFSHCFRAEAGAAGKQEKGLYRLHQFSKVEMFVLCTPSQSEEEFHNLVQIEEQFCEDFELEWRTMLMATQEMGNQAYLKYDIEALMPGRKRFGEVASISNCTDYQSRRLNIRFKPKNLPGSAASPAKNQYLHTLNGTACAIPRVLLSLLETHQHCDAEGRLEINLPEALAPYLPGIPDGTIREAKP